MKPVLTAKRYWRLRQAGYMPGASEKTEFESEELKRIILRQKELMDEVDSFDQQLQALAEQEHP